MADFLHQLGILLRLAIHDEIGRFRRRGIWAKLSLVIVIVLGLAFMVTFGLTLSQAGAIFLVRRGIDPAVAVPALLAGTYTVAGIMLLLAALPFGLATMSETAGLPILLTTPVGAKAVFTQRLLVAVIWESAITLVLLTPVTLGLASLVGAGPGYYVTAVLIILATPLIPLSLGQLAVFGLLRLVSARTVRAALGLVGALVGAGWIFLRGGADSGSGVRVSDVLTSAGGSGLWWVPFSWPGRALGELAVGNVAVALLFAVLFVGLSIAVFVGSVNLTAAVAEHGWFDVTTPVLGRRRASGQPDATASASFLDGPIRAVVAKDLKLIVRDPLVWTRLLGPLAAFGYVFYRLLDTATTIEGEFAWSLRAGAVMAAVGFLAWNLNNRFALSALNRERQAIVWLLTSPAPKREFVIGKALVAIAPQALLLFPAAVTMFVVMGFPPAMLLLQSAIAAAMLLVMTCWSMLIGASFPKFDWQDVRRVSTVPALALSSGVQLAMTVSYLLVAAVAPLAFDPRTNVTALSEATWFAVTLLVGVFPALSLWLVLSRLPKSLDRLELFGA